MVQGLGSRVWGLGFRVQGVGFRVGGITVEGLVLGAEDLDSRVQG